MKIAHYDDVIMGAMASQITSLTIVYSTAYSDTDQRTHQSSASLAFVRGIHRRPVNSPRKWPVTRKMFPIHDIIMRCIFMWSFENMFAARVIKHMSVSFVSISQDLFCCCIPYKSTFFRYLNRKIRWKQLWVVDEMLLTRLQNWYCYLGRF